MRTLFKQAIFISLTFFIAYSIGFAQETSVNPSSTTKMQNNKGISDQQKAMLQQRKEKKIEYNKMFQSSISQEQRDILEDPRLIQEDRQRKFRASLTDAQVSMIKAHKAEMKTMREEYRATLTPEQKEMMKCRARERRNGQQNGFRQGRMNGTGNPGGMMGRPDCPAPDCKMVK